MSAQNEMINEMNITLNVAEVVAVAVEVLPENLLPVTTAELLEADFRNDDEAEFLQAVLSLQQEIEDVLMSDDAETFLLPDETNLPPAVNFLIRLEELKSFAFSDRTLARMERRIRGVNAVVRTKMTETDKASHPNYVKCPDCLRHFTRRYIGFHMETDICVKVKTAHNLRPSTSSKTKVSEKIYNACYDLEDLFARAVDYRRNIEPELVEEEIVEDAVEVQDEDAGCVWVVKTWVYEAPTDKIEYFGLWEQENGNKEFATEAEARIQFEYAIATGDYIAVSLVKIDPDANEDRETCVEDWEDTMSNYVESEEEEDA
jgi:hypothetical protein